MFACKRHLILMSLLMLALGAVAAQAEDARIFGTIMAHEAEPGARGNWRYDLRVTWRNADPAGPSYLNLRLDDGGNCTESDILSYLHWDSPAGTAHFYDVNGAVYFDAELLMEGDPSLQIHVPVLRYTPRADSQVRPAPDGTAVFTFWSDLPPWPIDQPNDLLSEVFGGDHAFGDILGVFPGLPCDPITAEESDWGEVKARYGR